uniref:hypothetical protein n=1 Tax=Vibrio vulnificus TaxID=672 RepID=UPI0019D4EE92
FERIFLGSPKQSTFALQRLERLARHLGLWHDTLFARRFAALSMALDSHKAAGGAFISNWRAAGIGLLFMLVVLSVAIPVVMLVV